MKNSILIIALLVSSILQFSCSESIEQKPLNPNGDTELALLMRAMFEDGEAMKEALDSGRFPKVSKEHIKMLTAEATEPEKAASPEYKAFAQSYLQTLEALEKAEQHAANNLEYLEEYNNAQEDIEKLSCDTYSIIGATYDAGAKLKEVFAQDCDYLRTQLEDPLLDDDSSITDGITE